MTKIALMVGSMKNHMTSEGWEIALALQSSGYGLRGGVIDGEVDVKKILETDRPSVVVIQDKREWIGKTAGPGFDEKERFTYVDALAKRPDIFKATILKDAHADHALQREAAEEIGCHAWITYYHPAVVCHLAPYVRPEHVVRTYHTVDPAAVPEWLPGNGRWNNEYLVSGAVSGAYPLRKRLIESGKFKVLDHPRYGRNHCFTGSYLSVLSNFKVAICTASRYGYALRKIIEATAVGCRVVTDLPEDDVLPFIDTNLIRVHNDSSPENVLRACKLAADIWDENAQCEMALTCQAHYSYQNQGRLLSDAIDRMRSTYVS